MLIHLRVRLTRLMLACLLQPEAPAVYKAMPDSRIPVSSKRGGIWRSRVGITARRRWEI